MTNYLALPIGDAAPEVVNAVIEIPRGQTNKYEYDKSSRLRSIEILFTVHYPVIYGFIPSTLSLDGDPLDVLVLWTRPVSLPGCLMTVRPIGMLEMVDQGKQDEKILAVGTNNPIFKDMRDYTKLYPHLLLEIEHFFSVYKALEAKTTKIVGWHAAERSKATVIECGERYVEEAASVGYGL